MVGRNLRGPLRLPSQHQWSVCRDPNSAHEPILECARASRVRSHGSRTWREIQRRRALRSEEHTSELQSQFHLVCRLLLEKKKNKTYNNHHDKTKKKQAKKH